MRARCSANSKFTTLYNSRSAHEKICWRIYGRKHDAFHARIQRTEGGMQIPPVHNCNWRINIHFCRRRSRRPGPKGMLCMRFAEPRAIHANLQRAVECKTTSAPFQMLIKQTQLVLHTQHIGDT
jgi:hypothetical protein